MCFSRFTGMYETTSWCCPDKMLLAHGFVIPSCFVPAFFMCCAAPVAGNRNPFKTSMYHCWWTKSDKLINQLGRFQQHTTICPGAIFVHHQYRQWFGAQEKHRVFNWLQDGTFKHVFLLLPPLGRRHTEPLTETCLWTTYFNTDDQVNMISTQTQGRQEQKQSVS